MNIFLIGMMGSGKTTIGKSLARILKKECIDLDAYLVEKEKQTIPEIFASKGEGYFREKESFYLKELASKPNVIVATGGGAPCFNNNMDVINHGGISVFLDVPEPELFKRLVSQKKGRPLLESKSDEELKAFISSTLAKRRPFYEQAKYILRGANIRPEEIANKATNVFS